MLLVVVLEQLSVPRFLRGLSQDPVKPDHLSGESPSCKTPAMLPSTLISLLTSQRKLVFSLRIISLFRYYMIIEVVPHPTHRFHPHSN